MTVMSSQRFRNDEIVEEKYKALVNSGETKVVIPVINAYMKDFDDNDLFIMVDKHHTLEATKELGLNVEFEEVEDELSYYEDIENQNGEAICEANSYGDSWYYISINGNDEMYGVDVW